MNLLNYIVIIVLAVAGYMTYEPLVGSKGVLSGFVYKDKNEEEPKRPVQTEYVEVKPVELQQEKEEVPPIETLTFSLERVIREDFPQTCVTTQDSVKILLKEGPFSLKKGYKLTPVRLEGESLHVKVDRYGVYGAVPVAMTNFEELVKPRTMARITGQPMDEPQSDDTQVEKVEKVTNTSKPKEKEVNTVTHTLFGKANKVTPKEMENVLKNKQQTKKTEPVLKRLSEDQIKKMIRTNYSKLTTLKGQKLTGYSVGEDVDYAGKKHQSGVIKFKKNTLLGERELAVKALFFDGKLIKWVWSKSLADVK